MTTASTIEPAVEAERTNGLLAGTLALIVLAVIAKLAHVLAPQVPAAVWALGFGILAGSGSARVRAVPALPYQLPLTVGLILLGAQLDPQLFTLIGWQGVLIVGAFWLGIGSVLWAISRTGLLTPRLAGLFALGLIGCGVTAITGAAQTDRKAAGVPAVYATLVVLISGAIGLLVFPLAGGAFGLDAGQSGTFAGITLANSAEAVATAALHSDEAMGIAAGYKLLVNALQGVPILLYLWVFAPKSEPAHGSGVARTLLGRVPYFVWGFAAVAIAGALGAFSPDERVQLGHITRYAFFIALVGVGFRTRLDVVRRIGVRPVVIGVGLWAVAAGAVLLWIVL